MAKSTTIISILKFVWCSMKYKNKLTNKNTSEVNNNMIQ